MAALVVIEVQLTTLVVVAVLVVTLVTVVRVAPEQAVLPPQQTDLRVRGVEAVGAEAVTPVGLVAAGVA